MSIKEKIFKRAVHAVNSMDEIKKIIEKSFRKLNKLQFSNDNFKLFEKRVQQLIQMVRAHVQGRYQISNAALISVVFGLLYFVVPFDVVPDFIPFFGLLDDISIIYFIYNKVIQEIDLFVKSSTNYNE